MIEIEIKARVENPKNIERAIIKLGAAPTGIDNQMDTYYNSKSHDFKNTDEALRIRAQDTEYFLTYKGPRLDAISKTRTEFEVKIADTVNMGNILSSLGFYPVASIVKKRKKYVFGDLIIALDEVRGLGSFIEIEIPAKNPNNYEEKLETIFGFMDKLGISRTSAVRESYLELLLKENRVNDRSPLIE